MKTIFARSSLCCSAQPGARPCRSRFDRIVRGRHRASVRRPRSHRGDGGGRPVGRAQGRPRAVAVAGGLRRRDAGRRCARHGACCRCRSSSRAFSPRWSRSGCWWRSPSICRCGPARPSSACSRCCTATRMAREVAETVSGVEYMAGFALATATLHLRRHRLCATHDARAFAPAGPHRRRGVRCHRRRALRRSTRMIPKSGNRFSDKIMRKRKMR